MRRRDEYLHYFKDACRHKNVLMQIPDVVRHKLKINTTWDDYYRFGFYKSDKSWEDKSLYIGNLGSRYWPHEGNSLKFDRLFAIRSLQKSVLQSAGLPTPELIMKVGRDYPIDTLEKFTAEMKNVSVPVLTKFDGGGGGADIYALTPTDDGLLHDGEVVDAAWIWEKYEKNIQRGFIVESRIDNHPVLSALHPGSLNTLRIHTIKTADGGWHSVRPFLKIGRHDSYVDNLSAGGLFAGIDANGVAGVAYCRETLTSFAEHPDTGSRIEGVQIPFFVEAVDLAISASHVLGFMATFGWDIGISPSGPMLIEANPGWQFRNIQQRIGPLLTPEIAAGLMPRQWWTPWDRTHMYPQYVNDYAGGWWQRLMAARRRKWHDRLQEHPHK